MKSSFWFVRILLLAIVIVQGSGAGAEQRFELMPAPAPVDNPLKGLVPYARPNPDRFPHSMEFSYLALSDLMVGPAEFDWQPLEELLDDISSRGNQAVVRIYLEYPGKQNGIPPYLVRGGMKVHTYMNTNTAPFPPKEISTPDYEDARLHAALDAFITAWGEKYDNDPRLAYITAGLLGTWGEWHTYPRNDLWASNATQKRVLDAYEKSFTKTPVLLRYPAGDGHGYQTENASRPFGYHDDSFAWATIDTGKKSDDWFYMPALRAAGPAAINKWKTQPIGGEIRPEVWGKIFDERSQWPAEAQDFHDCVTETHASWLMDTGMFREVASERRRAKAIAEVRRMGYELFIPNATLTLDQSSGQCEIKIMLVNQGVAPFYADWPTEVALVGTDGLIKRRAVLAGLSVRGHLPREEPYELVDSFSTAGLSGLHGVLIRVIHPLAGGKPLRFANADQDKTLAGWLTIGQIDLSAR